LPRFGTERLPEPVSHDAGSLVDSFDSNRACDELCFSLRRDLIDRNRSGLLLDHPIFEPQRQLRELERRLMSRLNRQSHALGFAAHLEHARDHEAGLARPDCG
jgi:hypothetical protein